MNDKKSVYIIAEAGVNHNGSIDMAKQLIDVASDAGADAIKFQTFKTEKLLSQNAPKAQYQLNNTNPSESQFEMIKRLELDVTTHQLLIEQCKKQGIQFLSTPFDSESIELLAKVFDLPALKLPSGEITNSQLLLKASSTGKPIILSTGMSYLGEIEDALGVLAFGYLRLGERPCSKAFREAFRTDKGRRILKTKVTLLHCTTEYPAPITEVNLRAMDTLRSAFDLPVGYSDHTPGIAVPIAAVARGACIIEKHFTLDRSLPGPDHKASLEPTELKCLVNSIRTIQLAIGEQFKLPTASEIMNRPIARESLVAACDIRKGDIFNEFNLTTKRPGTGISPFFYWDWLGKIADKDYKQDELIDI